MVFSISHPVLWLLGGLYAILIFASVWIELLRWRAPSRDYSELVLRVRSW
jgi:predicted CDP-diglyceride synthetase/phosphatidate cytidylyltransferase